MKKMVAAVVLLLHSVVLAWAQGPNNSGTYYENANGTRGKQLKTALAAIINKHTVLSYGDLWDCYSKTDVRSDGKIWDMYSNSTDFDPVKDRDKGNHDGEGATYNREHSFPKSWFNKKSPMVTDLMHIVPTDSYVNGMRSSYPFGETNGEIFQSEGSFSKLGASKTPGFNGTVFEPADEYKGDFARIYFYMVTCYENDLPHWNCEMIDGYTYPAFNEWALKLLLRWAKNDPVSEKEINRNNAVFGIQKNRNPYVDYPGLEQYVWGGMMDATFNYADYDAKSVKYEVDKVPTTTDEQRGEEDNNGGQGTDIEITGSGEFVKVASAANLIVGNQYMIVYEDGANSHAMGASSNDIRSDVAITVDGNTTNGGNGVHLLTLGGKVGAYTLYDAAENKYLSLNEKKNKIHTADNADSDNAKWRISFKDDKVEIINVKFNNNQIQFNSSLPRFACYKGTQKAISLYMKKTSAATGIFSVDNGNVATIMVDVYSLDGRRVKHGVEKKQALNGLQKGIYIMDGKKYVVR
ncbi:MAG: endonuclease [Prevotella sp.]|nr:endonuclease [Prevotella sp.]